MRTRFIALATLSLVVGCGAAPPVTEAVPVEIVQRQPPTPPPVETERPQVVEPPEASRGCEIAFRTRARPGADRHFDVAVFASNLTDRPFEGTLTRQCPGLAVQFEGLPAGYTLGSTCTMGRCFEDLMHEAFVLAPGETRMVAQVSIAVAGDTCNAALPDGVYSLGGSLMISGARTCVANRATIEVGRAAERPRTEERCPAMACAYHPCAPGQSPPEGCAATCGCQ